MLSPVVLMVPKGLMCFRLLVLLLLMLCAFCISASLMLTSASYAADLLTVWLSIKILTLGRVLFGAARVFGEQSPLAATRGSRDDDD